MPNTCFVTTELAPFTKGGIGVLLSNLLKHYNSTASSFAVLYAGETKIDKLAFEVHYPNARLYDVKGLLLNQKFKPSLPDWAFTSHPFHLLSYKVSLALQTLKEEGIQFDIIEFPDWGGLAFCALQDKLLGRLGEATIAVRLHSTDSILRPWQPSQGAESSSVLADIERKALRDADKIIAHLPTIAKANAEFYGFDDAWHKRVKIEMPPVYVDSITRTEQESRSANSPCRNIVFSSKIQELKRTSVFVRACVGFFRRHPDFDGKAIILAAPTDDDYSERVRRLIPADLGDKFSFISNADNQTRNSLIKGSVCVFPAPYESFCLAAYEASMMGATILLNGNNPAFAASTPWKDRENCLKFSGTISSLIDSLTEALRPHFSLKSVVVEPEPNPYFLGSSSVAERNERRLRAETPIVSVIIPYFNMGLYVLDTLESILCSSYASIEILLVDDASTDAVSLDVLRLIETSERFSDVTMIRLAGNRGLSGARNEGIRYANGKYVLPLDADDLIHPDFISIGVMALERNDSYDFVVPQTAFFEDPSRLPNLSIVDYAVFVGEAGYSGLYNNRHSTATSLVRKIVFDANKYDENMDSYEDWDFYSQAVSQGRRFIVTNEVYFYYRRRLNSMVNTTGRERHVRNLAVIRAKRRFSSSVSSGTFSVMMDSEARLASLVSSGSSVQPDEVSVLASREATRQYIRMLQSQVSHLETLLQERNARLEAVQTAVAALPLPAAGAQRHGDGDRGGDPQPRSFLPLGVRVLLLRLRGGLDRQWYLEMNPDVRAAGVDPFVHYELHGRAEGRAPRREMSGK